MGLRTWTSVTGSWNGTWTYYSTGLEWQVENSDEDRIANNRSLVTVRLWVRRNSSSYAAYNLTDHTSWLEYDGGNRNNITTRYDFRSMTNGINYYVGYNTTQFPKGAYFSFYVTHNSDGTRSLPISTYLYGGITEFSSATVSTTLTLPTIPRYAVINSFSMAKASGGNGISRLTGSWSTDSSCDSVQYSLNSGSWVTTDNSGTSGTFNISGLSPATEYTVKIRVKRTDSQLWTESSTDTETTYDYAKLTSVPAGTLSIDDSHTIQYTNPSGGTMNISLYIGSTTPVAAYRTCTSTSYTFTYTSGEKTVLYDNTKTTTSISLTFYLRTEDGLGNYYYSYDSRTFAITDADPTFTTYTIADTNTTTLALTDDDTKIVSGYSNIAATITVANRAIGVKSATVSDYKFYVGGVLADTDLWSNDTIVTLTKSSATSATTTITATDGRGNDTTVGVNGTLINYTDITNATISSERQTALSEETDLVVTGTFWNGDFGTVSNTLSATYEYRETGTSTWTAGTTDITPTVVGNDYSINATIVGDTATGFNTSNSYDIKVTLTDELDSLALTTYLTTSKPPLCIDTGGIAVNTVYDTNLNDGLQVGGKIYLNGVEFTGGGSSLTKAAGTDIDTGTDDAKYVTSKAIEDSNLVRSTDTHVTDIVTVTKAEYDAIGTKSTTTLYNITDDTDYSIGVQNNLTSTSTVDALSAYQGKVLNDKFSEVILYNNSTGTTGNVTLSETSANFTYIDTYFKYNGQQFYTRTLVGNGITMIGCGQFYENSLYWLTTIYEIAGLSGTTITRNEAYRSRVQINGTNSCAGITQTGQITIIRVTGIK